MDDYSVCRPFVPLRRYSVKDSGIRLNRYLFCDSRSCPNNQSCRNIQQGKTLRFRCPLQSAPVRTEAKITVFSWVECESWFETVHTRSTNENKICLCRKGIYELMVESSSTTLTPDVIKSAGILAIHLAMGLCSQV